jgi:hypothetical protein
MDANNEQNITGEESIHAELLDNIDQTEAETPPVAKGPLTWRPFPVDVFPASVREFIRQTSESLQADESFIALPILVCAAAAIGNARRLRARSTWDVPPILWGAIVGRSGTTKTPALRAVVRFARDRQKRAFDQCENERAEYNGRLFTWNKIKKADRNLDDHPGDQPQPERFFVSDITVEALADRLENSQRGILTFVDELAGWVKGFGQFKHGKGSDVESWLALYDGQSLIIDRKTGDKPTIRIERAAVCVLGGIQPGTLGKCFSTDFYENGLAARILLVWPPEKRKRWSEAEISPEALQAMADVFVKLYSMKMTNHETDTPTPGIVRLDADAKKAFIEYFNKHNAELEHLANEAERAFYSKLEGGAVRLALVIHSLRWACGESAPFEMDVQSMAAGITLAQWFRHEALRVYRLLHADSAEKRDILLAEWISQRGGSVTARDLQNAKGTRFRFSGDALQAIEALVQRGWGKWREKPPGPKGGRSTTVFVLNPATTCDNCDTTPK